MSTSNQRLTGLRAWFEARLYRRRSPTRPRNRFLLFVEYEYDLLIMNKFQPCLWGRSAKREAPNPYFSLRNAFSMACIHWGG